MRIKTLSEIKDPNAPYIILFHGYGADATDLRPLADVIPTKKPFNYIFPEGPLAVPLGPHWVGRAWNQINLERLQNPHVDYDLTHESPKELPQTRRLIADMIRDLKVPMDRIILGGFSQGGMMAVDQFFSLPESPKALVLLSTALVNKAEWKSLGKNKKPVPYFLSHGTQDPVLRIKYSDQLHSFLAELGMKGERHVFQGVHEIPMVILQKLGSFLDNLPD
ncbi:MAG: alpha/beta hydrolase [Bdellovibrionales bacterium]